MVPGHSLDRVTRQWNVIEKRIDSCLGGKLCLDSLHVFFRISFHHHQIYGIPKPFPILSQQKMIKCPRHSAFLKETAVSST